MSGSKSVHDRFPKGPAEEPGLGEVGESLFFSLFLFLYFLFSQAIREAEEMLH